VASVVARDERHRLAALWGGILIPPTAWMLHLLVAYLLVTLACLSNWSAGVLALLLHGLTVALILLTVGSTLLAWRAGHAAPATGDTAAARERRAFMVHVALALSALFVLLILAGDVPNFFVAPCPGGP
jgi:hypothetical protein